MRNIRALLLFLGDLNERWMRRQGWERGTYLAEAQESLASAARDNDILCARLFTLASKKHSLDGRLAELRAWDGGRQSKGDVLIAAAALIGSYDGATAEPILVTELRRAIDAAVKEDAAISQIEAGTSRRGWL